MTAEDRIALILGRAIMQAEALQVANEQLRTRLAEIEAEANEDQSPKSPGG